MKSATVIAPGAGEKFWIVGDHITFKLSSAESNGRFAVAENFSTIGGGPPPHRHRREDELFYVLEGELDFLREDKTFRGGPGTAVYLPKEIIHTFRVTGDRPSRQLVIACPGGFDRFIERAGMRVDRFPQNKPVNANDIEKLLTLAPEFGLDILPDHKPTGPAPARRADRPLWVMGQLITIKLTGADTNGNFSVAEIIVYPGDGVPLHTHREMDEMFYVIDGTAQFRLEHGTVDAPAGTFVYVPAGVWHGFRCDRHARLADFPSPGGFEHFFEEVGELCTDANAPPPPFNLDRALQIILKHGMDLPPR
jgi:mannose-6-phosphate isomerase-like protein (cupin superfamily)